MTIEAPKRRAPTRDEKQATLCLMIKRGDGTPIISYTEAKAMTPKEIIAEFDRRIHWHHNIEHAIGGGLHPTNLEALPPDEHKQIPSSTRVAKTKRISAGTEEFRRRMLAKSGQAPAEPKRKRSKAKLSSAGFLGWRRFDGTPVRRKRRRSE